MLTWIALCSCTLISVALSWQLWRRDVFFASFYSLLVLYSVVPMWGYFLYPEISDVVLNMYFGTEPLAGAVAFTAASFIALFVGYHVIYRPLVEPVRVVLEPATAAPPALLIFQAAYVACLALGYLYYFSVLDYSNASDETLLEALGITYRLFWAAFKFSTFVLLVGFAIMRSDVLIAPLDRQLLRVVLALHFALFAAISASVGSRTDPLALALGVLAFEWCRRNASDTPARRPRGTQRGRFAIMALIFLMGVGALLTILEMSRSEGALTREDLEASALVQAILLKDYYWPYHVLIGAISSNYIDPLTVIQSNTATAAIGGGVDYLQTFIVSQWGGYTSRTASPAFFAFAEGFLALGWLGFVYNGIVWSGGLALWRMLSRSTDERFNALAFALCVSVAATVARTQSSYFIKDLYLWFAPALYLYLVAAGLRLSRSRRLALVSVHAQ